MNNNGNNNYIPQNNYDPYTGKPTNANQYYQAPIRTVIKKQYNPLDKKDALGMLLFFIASFLVVDFGFFHFMNLGFFIAYVIMFVMSYWYLNTKGGQKSLFGTICGALSLIAASSFMMNNDNIIKTLNVVLIGGLFSIMCICKSGNVRHKNNYKMGLDMLDSVFVRPFADIPNIVGGVKASTQKNKKFVSSLIGVLVALPFAVIVITLLANSDAAFGGLVKTVITNIGIYIGELILTIIITPYVFAFLHAKREEKKGIKKEHKTHIVPASGCISFLSVLSLVYVVYLFTQLAYFFSSFSGILPDDYTKTASSFARKGFFEMFAVSVINVVIISIVVAICKKNKNHKTPVAIKCLSCFIALFSILLLITALSKMQLNIETYGLSKNRLLVLTFMIMLFIADLFFIVHIFAPKVRYMQPLVIICSVLFIVLSFANIDAITAKYNVEQYLNGNITKIDMEYFNNLSDASVPYIIKLTDAKDKKIASDANRLIADKFDRIIDEEKATDFREYNIAQNNAEKSIRKYVKEVNGHKKDVFDNVYNLEKQDDSSYDEYDNKYYTMDGVYSFDNKTGLYVMTEDYNKNIA